MNHKYYMIERRSLDDNVWRLRDSSKYYSTSEAKHAMEILNKNWAGRFAFRIIRITQEIFEGY